MSDGVSYDSSFRLSGDNLQGVSLRKAIHSYLRPKGSFGLAINDPYTGDVVVHLDKAKHAKGVLSAAKKHLRSIGIKNPNVRMSEEAYADRRGGPVLVTDEDLIRFRDRQGLMRHRGDMDWLRNYAAARYNLHRIANGEYMGVLPDQAIKQLEGEAPVYNWQFSERGNPFYQEKKAFLETLRHGAKALRGALFGGVNLAAPKGVMYGRRLTAAQYGRQMADRMAAAGVPLHRARVKSPGSIMGNLERGAAGVPDDLFGGQLYARNVGEARKAFDALSRTGVRITDKQLVNRPGYYGVNVKGMYKGTPVELQMSPGRVSNFGQMMNHALAYKQKAEAPMANMFDRWVGRAVMPRIVRNDRWAREMQGVL